MNLIIALMLVSLLGLAGLSQGWEGEPSDDVPIRWEIEEGTGSIIALFKGVKYKYHVENILKGKDCLIPTSGRMLKWSSGDNGQGVCYFTMKTPGWAMWENCSGWTWLGRRIKNYGKH